MAEQLYEVLTRRPDGHETVHRVTASSKAAAIDRLVDDHGVEREHVVDATPYRPAS